ncbi:S1C family serine protease [Paraliobacillus ryukyuensis]|uniref:S1C family serine protease n=1 Tax=Paraliobacillus ryukyuensis TaxID=200904 RepID=UPI0009A6911C|nr:trypsin-like peptidase domain-containing protein [Paraliobacillus ryukyuensis]
MKQKKMIYYIALGIALTVLTVAASFFYYQHWAAQEIHVENNLAKPIDNQTGEKMLASVIHDAQKSVVQITVETETSERTGSGFLYNALGDIITNAHVVKDATSITVTMSNAETYKAAIVGIGDKTDIAVIRVPQLTNRTVMHTASESLAVGDEIIAIGSPLGFQNSVSVGIISGTNRSFDVDGFNYKNVYQISANITHGNSGGPLINRNNGEIVGINSAGVSDSDIAFSIPIEQVMEQVTEWSNSINNNDLVFPSTSLDLKLDASKVKEDAEYLVNYFFESLQIRDYINAYTLLGSDLQTDQSYSDFRSAYVHYTSLTVNDINVVYESDKEQAQVIASVELQKVDQDDPESWSYTFSIGYENDQLKILKYDSSLSEES